MTTYKVLFMVLYVLVLLGTCTSKASELQKEEVQQRLRVRRLLGLRNTVRRHLTASDNDCKADDGSKCRSRGFCTWRSDDKDCQRTPTPFPTKSPIVPTPQPNCKIQYGGLDSMYNSQVGYYYDRSSQTGGQLCDCYQGFKKYNYCSCGYSYGSSDSNCCKVKCPADSCFQFCDNY